MSNLANYYSFRMSDFPKYCSFRMSDLASFRLFHTPNSQCDDPISELCNSVSKLCVNSSREWNKCQTRAIICSLLGQKNALGR